MNGTIAHLPGAAFAGKDDDTFNVAFAEEPEPLDSYKIAGRQGLIPARHIFDDLPSRNLDIGEIVPAFAESWAFPDDLTMEFKLQQGVKFHNGSDFPAEDMIATRGTVINPEYGTLYAISIDWIDWIEKLGDCEVRINMSKPFAGALEMLADALPLYPRERIEAEGSERISRDPVCTGPDRLVRQEPGVRYAMDRLADHDVGSPKSGATIDTIDGRTIPDLKTQCAELMAGDLEWIWCIPPIRRRVSRIACMSSPLR